MNKLGILLTTTAMSLLIVACSKSANYGKPVLQVSIEKVDKIPNMPTPYKILDWKARAIAFDKTKQDGHNYVKMEQNYFNSDNGWNIVMNNTCPKVALLGGGYSTYFGTKI